MSRAYTAEELRKMFLDHIRQTVSYWRTCKLHDGQDRLDGLAFSILVAIDGHAGGFPCAVDLLMRPHPDDKNFAISGGENWIEDGTGINDDILLHEEFYSKETAK